MKKVVILLVLISYSYSFALNTPSIFRALNDPKKEGVIREFIEFCLLAEKSKKHPQVFNEIVFNRLNHMFESGTIKYRMGMRLVSEEVEVKDLRVSLAYNRFPEQREACAEFIRAIDENEDLVLPLQMEGVRLDLRAVTKPILNNHMLLIESPEKKLPQKIEESSLRRAMKVLDIWGSNDAYLGFNGLGFTKKNHCHYRRLS